METKTDKLITENKVIDEMIKTEESYNQAISLLNEALSITKM